ISYHFGRWRLGQLLESETVDGLAKSADFDIDIFVCSKRLDRRGPARKLLAQPAGIRADSDQPADMVEHDFRIRACTSKVRDIVKVWVKNQSIERESEMAQHRESLTKRLVAEQAGRCRIGRIEE